MGGPDGQGGRRRRGHLPDRIGRDRAATLAASAILGIGTDGILAVSGRSAAALALTSLVVGLGAVLRSAAATITTAVAVLFAPPILGALVSNEVVATVMDYLPAGDCPTSPRPLTMLGDATADRKGSHEGIHL